MRRILTSVLYWKCSEKKPLLIRHLLRFCQAYHTGTNGFVSDLATYTDVSRCVFTRAGMLLLPTWSWSTLCNGPKCIFRDEHHPSRGSPPLLSLTAASPRAHVAVVGWPDRQTVERASELFTSNFNFNFFCFNLLSWSRKGMHKLARWKGHSFSCSSMTLLLNFADEWDVLKIDICAQAP